MHVTYMYMLETKVYLTTVFMMVYRGWMCSPSNAKCVLYKDLRQHWYEDFLSYEYHLSIIGHEHFPPPCFTVVCVLSVSTSLPLPLYLFQAGFNRHYLYTSFKLGSIPQCSVKVVDVYCYRATSNSAGGPHIK